jgi:hypothetical protein
VQDVPVIRDIADILAAKHVKTYSPNNHEEASLRLPWILKKSGKSLLDQLLVMGCPSDAIKRVRDEHTEFRRKFDDTKSATEKRAKLPSSKDPRVHEFVHKTLEQFVLPPDFPEADSRAFLDALDRTLVALPDSECTNFKDMTEFAYYYGLRKDMYSRGCEDHGLSSFRYQIEGSRLIVGISAKEACHNAGAENDLAAGFTWLEAVNAAMVKNPGEYSLDTFFVAVVQPGEGFYTPEGTIFVEKSLNADTSGIRLLFTHVLDTESWSIVSTGTTPTLVTRTMVAAINAIPDLSDDEGNQDPTEKTSEVANVEAEAGSLLDLEDDVASTAVAPTVHAKPAASIQEVGFDNEKENPESEAEKQSKDGAAVAEVHIAPASPKLGNTPAASAPSPAAQAISLTHNCVGNS